MESFSQKLRSLLKVQSPNLSSQTKKNKIPRNIDELLAKSILTTKNLISKQKTQNIQKVKCHQRIGKENKKNFSFRNLLQKNSLQSIGLMFDKGNKTKPRKERSESLRTRKSMSNYSFDKIRKCKNSRNLSNVMRSLNLNDIHPCQDNNSNTNLNLFNYNNSLSNFKFNNTQSIFYNHNYRNNKHRSSSNENYPNSFSTLGLCSKRNFSSENNNSKRKDFKNLFEGKENNKSQNNNYFFSNSINTERTNLIRIEIQTDQLRNQYRDIKTKNFNKKLFLAMNKMLIHLSKNNPKANEENEKNLINAFDEQNMQSSKCFQTIQNNNNDSFFSKKINSSQNYKKFKNKRSKKGGESFRQKINRTFGDLMTFDKNMNNCYFGQKS